jgi:hypothetical protein
VESRDESSVSIPFGTVTNDVVKIKEFNAVDGLDVFAFKYYAPGVGTLLEFDPESGERVELVEMIAP